MKKIRQMLLIALVTVVVSIAAAELTLRIRCSMCSWSEANKGRYQSPFRVQGKGWFHLRPANRSKSYQQPEFDFPVCTNSLGVRDIEHPVDKPKDETRLVALGDSFTEGQGAAFEDGYAKQLEVMLNARGDQTRYRVLIGGVWGSDPFYCYQLLQHKMLEYSPDLVMLMVNQSDVVDVIVRGGHKRFLADGTVRFNEPPPYEALRRWSHLFRFITIRFFNYDWSGFSPESYAREQDKAVHSLTELFGDFEELGQRHGFDFVVILHPMDWEVAAGGYSLPLEQIRASLAEGSIRHVDVMEPVLQATGQSRELIEEYYWLMDHHFKAVGYRLIAETVLEGLEDMGALSPVGPNS